MLHSGAMAVFQHLDIAIPYSIQALLRCFDIGLADIEMIYGYAFFLCSFCIRHEFADRRGGHFDPAVADC
jgi:hypothetical protein